MAGLMKAQARMEHRSRGPRVERGSSKRVSRNGRKLDTAPLGKGSYSPKDPARPAGAKGKGVSHPEVPKAASRNDTKPTKGSLESITASLGGSDPAKK